jgi:hypothetical protein
MLPFAHRNSIGPGLPMPSKAWRSICLSISCDMRHYINHDTQYKTTYQASPAQRPASRPSRAYKECSRQAGSGAAGARRQGRSAAAAHLRHRARRAYTFVSFARPSSSGNRSSIRLVDAPKFQMAFSFGGALTQKGVGAAIEQMLFVGGTLNQRILSSWAIVVTYSTVWSSIAFDPDCRPRTAQGEAISEIET